MMHPVFTTPIPNLNANTNLPFPQSLSKEPANSSQNTILLWVIWMVLAGNLEQGRKGGSIRIDSVSYTLSDLL